MVQAVGRLAHTRAPAIDDVEQRRERRPSSEAAIVHGDRFGNRIVDPAKRRVAAVLDWELCTLGDAMADLGHLGIYWHDPALPLPITNDPTSAGGFPPFRDLLHRYAARTDRDVSQIEYYRAFAAWRLAIIAEGVASRHLRFHPDDAAALAASHEAVERPRLRRDALDRLPRSRSSARPRSADSSARAAP
jgi:aminoglycoside phosphotransferase (APT) family kinase protein